MCCDLLAESATHDDARPRDLSVPQFVASKDVWRNNAIRIGKEEHWIQSLGSANVPCCRWPLPAPKPQEPNSWVRYFGRLLQRKWGGIVDHQ
jgi:hypothetical protein